MTDFLVQTPRIADHGAELIENSSKKRPGSGSSA